MTDKNLEKLQNVLKSALKLRVEMNNCLCSIALNRDGYLLEAEQFGHLSNAKHYIDISINQIKAEIESELLKRGKM